MRQEAQRSVPAVVFDHVVEFNDVLPLFVFLAALKGLFLKGGWGLSSLELREVVCTAQAWHTGGQSGALFRSQTNA